MSANTSSPAPDDDGRNRGDRPLPAPEGVNLLGTPERVREKTDADRRRYAVGPFGQTWLWTFSIVLCVTSLYKLVAGPLLATALPTTKGVVLGWITIPARTITYAPRIAYEVGGVTYRFVSGTVTSTLTGAPTHVTVAYVPFAPSSAIWSSGEWWASFQDVYLMILLILGLILFVVAIYQWRIRGYWTSGAADLGAASYRYSTGIGAVVLAGGAAWLVSAYLDPVSWFIPPEPNLIAAFVVAIGMALLVAGLYHRRRGLKQKDEYNDMLARLSPEEQASFTSALARWKAEAKASRRSQSNSGS